MVGYRLDGDGTLFSQCDNSQPVTACGVRCFVLSDTCIKCSTLACGMCDRPSHSLFSLYARFVFAKNCV